MDTVSPITPTWAQSKRKRLLQIFKSVSSFFLTCRPRNFFWIIYASLPPLLFKVIRRIQPNPSFKEKKRDLNQSSLLCCKLFISESKNQDVLDSIDRAARPYQDAAIVNKFVDRAYNQVIYTVVSYVVHGTAGKPIYSPLHQTVLAMVQQAYNGINLELHSGGHPRLGVVDNIVVHPLARASLDEAAWLAKAVAVDIGNQFQVPVFLYGEAHPTRKELSTLRRELGYFRPNAMGSQGAGLPWPKKLPFEPNEGPSLPSRDSGITTVGAAPWTASYNVPILSTDVSAARRIARKVSARGGGLPKVQSLGLPHDDTVEVACVLLEPDQVGADQVQEMVEMLASQEGLEAKKGYFVDFSPEELVKRYMSLISRNDGG